MIAGKVTQVIEEVMGSELVADVAGGALNGLVQNIDDFDLDDGGDIRFADNGEVVGYDVADEETGQLAFRTPLAGPHLAGVRVELEPAVKERYALFQEEGDSGGEQWARVPIGLKDRLGLDMRSPDDAELIEAEWKDERLLLHDILLQDPDQTAEYIRPNTFTAPPSDGAAPTSSPTPTVTGGPNFIGVTWSPVINVDPVIYEVHVSATNGFVAGPSTKIGEVLGQGFIITKLPSGASLAYSTTYYVKLIAKDQDGSALASVQASGQMVKLPSSSQASDSIAPSAVGSAPSVRGGATFFALKWDPVLNNDAVTYEVHVSTTTGFTPDGTTKYGETPGTSMIVNRTAAGGALVYGTTYFFKIVAKDVDGSAAASSQGSGTMVKLVGGSSGDINADTITANELAANSVTAAELAANSVVAGSIVAGTFSSQSVVADKFVAGSIAGDRIVASSITADRMNVSTLSAISANLGTITAGTVTGATLQTAAGAVQRTVMDGSGLRAYGSDGTTVVVNLPNSGSPSFTGTLRTDDLAVTGASPAAAVGGWGIGTSPLSAGPLFNGRVGSALSPPAYAQITSGHGVPSSSNTYLTLEDDWGSAQPWLNLAQITLRGGATYKLIDGAGASDFARSIGAGTGISVTGSNPNWTVAIDTGVVPRKNVGNIFTTNQSFQPASDVSAAAFFRGTDIAPTANIVTFRKADNTLLSSISPEGYGNFPQGIGTQVAAGAVTDANYGVQAASGSLGLDTSNKRLYARVGSTWNFIPISTVAPPNYTTNAYTVRRNLPASATVTLAQVADVLATLLDDFGASGAGNGLLT